MLVWNFFDFSHWSLERLESEAGLQSKGAQLKRERAHLAGRLALHQLLKNQGLPQEITSNQAYGFLELQNCFGSIAHTEEICVAALSSFPVGIDLEHSQREVKPALNKIASDQEIKNLEYFQSELKTQIKDRGLFLWTAKEAFSKAVGLGLRKGIKDLEVLLIGAPPFRGEISCQTPLALENPAISFHLIDQYLVSVCFEKKLGTTPLQPSPFRAQKS
ncbi:4'-phosphopantetheinyl transferase superfamily protein [bacterium]|nr:4'-phosphopantetheinyl transferase superfamily protein [bacterium]